MPVVLAAMTAYVLMGLASRRIGPLQHALALGVGAAVATAYLFTGFMD